MNAKRIIITAGLVALSVAEARADLRLTVKAKQPSRVYLDGRAQGRAPVSLANLGAGAHWVDVQNLRNGRFQRVRVVAPRGVWARKTVSVDFRRPRPVTVVTHPTVRVAPRPVYRYQPAQAPVYTVPAPSCSPVVETPQRDYVRKRNTLLALGAANELFNRGGDRKDLRGALVGATVLNEIFNK